MRKREQELEEQLAAKKTELSDKAKALVDKVKELADMNQALADAQAALAGKEQTLAEKEQAIAEQSGALADKENALRSMTEQLAALQSKLQEQDVRISIYQERETALVSAMVQAEKMSRSKLSDAEAQADNICGDAKRQAEELLAAAKEQASNILKQAEASAQEYKMNTDRLNDQLMDAAQRAKEQLSTLQSWMENALVQTDNVDQIEEIRSLRDTLCAPAVETPEEYQSSAELMKNIYNIEGRTLPETEEAKPAAQENAAEHTAPADAEEEPAQQPAYAAEEAFIPENVPAEETAQSPAADWFNTPPEPAKAEPEQVVQSAEEPRMWTVDEIVSSVIDGDSAVADTGSDAYLKQLIDDILQ